MTTRQIDCILELSQTSSFGRAAENLYISQPTLSYQIRQAEEEIGFRIFERSGRGASLTPAGTQFCTALRSIRDELKNAIEQGQNFSARYEEAITIGLPLRSAIHFLPRAMAEFARRYPAVSVSPRFNPLHDVDAFLRGEQDIVFAEAEDVRRVPDVRLHSLFESRFYLIAERDDPLARLARIRASDLAGRTLMVGGGSPRALRELQREVIAETGIDHFNSADHETTLTNVAAHRGVCIAPGFLNDHSGEFAWIPFDTERSISCVLCTHSDDNRESVAEFVRTLQRLYKENPDFPV